MAATEIEWAEYVWNPTRGCNRVSQGCKKCYAERVAARFSGPGQPYEGLITRVNGQPTWNGKIKLVPELLEEPRHWKKPRRIFVDSMSDLFHEKVPSDYVGKVFETIARCPQHTFIILTKRPERIAEVLGPRGCGWYATEGPVPCPQPNAWIGASAEDQETADLRIPYLVNAPVAVRVLSVEPQLGSINLCQNLPNERMLRWHRPMIQKLDWIIVGGESDYDARPFNLEWAFSLVRQAGNYQVPIFVKQMGSTPIALDGSPAEVIQHRKGADMAEWPSELRIRQYPPQVVTMSASQQQHRAGV